MAKRLDSFPDNLQVRTTEAYPWDDWFDGSAWELKKGEDYLVKTKSFVSNAQAKARNRGGSLRTASLPNDSGVVIQYKMLPLGSGPVRKPPASLVRTWAKANGWPDLSDRGSLPADIVKAYHAANGGKRS